MSFCASLRPLERDLVVIGREGTLLQELLGLVERLSRISRQHALVEDFRRRQSGAISEHHVQELQTLDVAAHDHEADRQRSSENEADRTPQCGPERRRQNHRQRRKSGAAAIQMRFDQVSRERLQNKEQRRRPQQECPAWVTPRPALAERWRRPACRCKARSAGWRRECPTARRSEPR